jgi:hypothetical protein
MENIKEFFNNYEKANKAFDVDKMGSFYGEIFLFGQPQGVQAIPKSGFLSVLPKRKEFFKTIGLLSSEIHTIQIKEIASNYFEAYVEWKMHFEKGSKKVEEITKTTYVLHKGSTSIEIVFQIDHQDLMKKVKELGLL